MLRFPLFTIDALSDTDLELVAHALAWSENADAIRTRLDREPEAINELLAEEGLFDALYGPEQGEDALRVGITPLLAFGVLVHKAIRDLEEATFVAEWVGAGQRLPVFDVETLREFAADNSRRRFLIEFLVSFTRVASGVRWERTRRGYRRRRFSELDPVALAEMVDTLPPQQRAGGYRRLGDVSLFLSGVFPDHTTRQRIGELARLRLARSAGIDDDLARVDEGAVRFFEQLGGAWYGRAAEATSPATDDRTSHLRQVADHFTDARRFVNYLSDRYLHRFDTGLMHPAA